MVDCKPGAAVPDVADAVTPTAVVRESRTPMDSFDPMEIGLNAQEAMALAAAQPSQLDVLLVTEDRSRPVRRNPAISPLPPPQKK